jgi:hypothetical protein
MSSSLAQQERSAHERNLQDMARVDVVLRLVDELLGKIARIAPLEHPDSRWHPDDLRQALRGTLLDLRAERVRIQAPLLRLDDEDITASIRELADE